MKPGQVAQLRRAALARKQIEESRLAAFRRAQAVLIAEAEELEASARQPIAESDAESGADLAFYGRAQALLETRAQMRRREARAIDPQRFQQESALRSALKIEIASRQLESDCEEERRRNIGMRDEERREALALLNRMT